MFSETNYYYLRRMFSDFYRGFGPRQLFISIIIALIAYTLALYVQVSREERFRPFNGRALTVALMCLYVYLVILYTIVFRPVNTVMKYRLVPFWSYLRVIKGSKYQIFQIIFNYVMMMPVGIFVPLLVREYRLTAAVLCGAFFTCCIEFTQLFLRRGTFDVDDIIGNLFGVLLGYAVYKAAGFLIYCARTNRETEKQALEADTSNEVKN